MTSSDESLLIGQHPVDTTQLTFDSLKLSTDILAAIGHVGFKNPTPIQSAVIPTALEGKDLIGLAQTGSGKTAAFVIPIAERLLHGKGLRGLILCPTREIALQTKAFLDLFGKHHQLQTVCVIGGVKINPQIQDIKKKPDIIVATPGRLMDLMERKAVKLDEIQELVLDEADHMLDLGFLPQIQEILRALPKERRTMMFSATMPDAIERLTKQFLKNPVRIDIMPEGRAATGISHRLYMVELDNKKNCLIALLHQELGSTLVFTRTKRDADWIAAVLKRENQPVTLMHSDRSQSERVEALQSFREGEHRILVATDIVSRGIDVPNIQHIINFDIPENVEEYIHRGGRTARGNTKGLVSTIATWQDLPLVRQIEGAISQELPRCTVPGVKPYIEQKFRPAAASGRRRGGW